MIAGYEKLTVAELREIVASVLFSRDSGDDASRRTMLNNEDTIH